MSTRKFSVEEVIEILEKSDKAQCNGEFHVKWYDAHGYVREEFCSFGVVLEELRKQDPERYYWNSSGFLYDMETDEAVTTWGVLTPEAHSLGISTMMMNWNDGDEYTFIGIARKLRELLAGEEARRNDRI